MKVLVACEFSGVVRNAFRRLGHDAWSCDLVPAQDQSEYHLVQDAVELAYNEDWDLLIAHPPCTYLLNSGVKHLYLGGKKGNGRDEHRWDEMRKAADFFNAMLDAPVERIAVENPRLMCHSLSLLRRPSDQHIQPWQFGHGETKETHLWLKNLPALVPTNVVDGRVQRVHLESPGVKNGLTRQQRRSVTYQGIAEAMADQWGVLETSPDNGQNLLNFAGNVV